ncbi:hypothetical protein LHYA1_G003141 [Lachnellula hyalina]|uniref:Uncharacterized protein n=1 Tax=Lachnellula hyalina TaxID=1316788 RepID=A0A8H8R272_9HELO|nr:uncharacterized protein LHYA1_G003141 [Lachnellula hyalina]TVY27093.1 hypothetical protein LHYA1_G003141 [Lachnellula hyalina]
MWQGKRKLFIKHSVSSLFLFIRTRSRHSISPPHYMSTLTPHPSRTPLPAHLASPSFEKPSTHFCAPRTPILPLLSLDLIHNTTTFQLSPPPSPSPPTMSKVPEMQEVSSLFAAARAVDTETELPPPPYAPASLPRTQNPGFCAHAFSERAANSVPGGGRTGTQYFEACPCGFIVSDSIPASYKEGWPGWIDPSVNYRWESHLPPSNFTSTSTSSKKLDLEEGGGRDWAAGSALSMMGCGRAGWASRSGMRISGAM